MKEKTWFETMLDTVKDSFQFRLETIILDVTEQISKRMKEKHTNRTQLAKALNVSPAAVTKILNGNSNFTLKTLLSLSDALDLDLAVHFKPKEILAQAQTTLATWTIPTGNVELTTTAVTTGTLIPMESAQPSFNQCSPSDVPAKNYEP